MAPPRFLVPDIPSLGPLELDETEAKHASSVLRLKVGDAVSVFDGRGGQADGHITACQKREVRIELSERNDSNLELPFRLTLLVALPKGDRQKVLVDGLVQLGVTRLIPLHSQRGVAQPSGNAMERLARCVVESSKQCGRNRLMEIAQPRAISQLDDLADPATPQAKLVAHPYGVSQPLSHFTALTPSPTETLVAVGPEGGFTDEEIAAFAALGWSSVSLGPRILRIEMAAIMLASCLASALERASN